MWTLTSSKGQSSIEAAMLISFMILTLTIFLLVMGNQYVTAQEGQVRQKLRDVAAMVETELSTASTAQDGYYRRFEIPRRAGGLNFSIKFYNASVLGGTGPAANFSELVLAFEQPTLYFETYIYLPPNVDGNVSHGYNELRKQRGILYIRNETG